MALRGRGETVAAYHFQVNDDVAWRAILAPQFAFQRVLMISGPTCIVLTSSSSPPSILSTTAGFGEFSCVVITKESQLLAPLEKPIPPELPLEPDIGDSLRCLLRR